MLKRMLPVTCDLCTRLSEYDGDNDDDDDDDDDVDGMIKYKYIF